MFSSRSLLTSNKGLVLNMLYFKILEKKMATHSSTLAWKIPWTEEPGGLQSMGCKESDATDRLHFTPFTRFIPYHWRRKWQPTPVSLPGESHGRKSLVGHGPWGLRESDTTEVTKHACTLKFFSMLFVP